MKRAIGIILTMVVVFGLGVFASVALAGEQTGVSPLRIFEKTMNQTDRQVSSQTVSAPEDIATAALILCSRIDCSEQAPHEHDGAAYLPHHNADGHSYHSVCNVSGCFIVENHEHNGILYKGHSSGDGCAFHADCTMLGCVAATAHDHGGCLYQGHGESGNSNNSYSGYSCPIAGCAQISAHSHQNEHSGGHHSDGGNGHH